MASQKKINIRNGHKGHITKLRNESEHIDKTDRTSVRKIFKGLTDKKALLKKLDDEIFNLIEDSDTLNKEIEQSSTIFDEINELIAKLKEVLNSDKSHNET